MLSSLCSFLPSSAEISGRYIDPFVGGAAVFFYVRPRRALLSDINADLIDLYMTLRHHPSETWDQCGLDPSRLDAPTRAARLLYLSRTCFKGMWRHNKKGQFNVGYGGESRRWVVTRRELQDASRMLRSADLRCGDFEPILDEAKRGDFVFLAPPYRPGAKRMHNAHYVAHEFGYSDQVRLAHALERASDRGIRWTMTNSAHADILSLYQGHFVVTMDAGTGSRPGLISRAGGEAVILSQGPNTHPFSTPWASTL